MSCNLTSLSFRVIQGVTVQRERLELLVLRCDVVIFLTDPQLDTCLIPQVAEP